MLIEYINIKIDPKTGAFSVDDKTWRMFLTLKPDEPWETKKNRLMRKEWDKIRNFDQKQATAPDPEQCSCESPLCNYKGSFHCRYTI
jgi:hypothetical protein